MEGPRGRRSGRRGPVPEHDPAVLPDRCRDRAAADQRRVRAALGRHPGAQPLARRLLRAGPRPPRRHRADLPEQRRRRGARGPLGARARPAGRGARSQSPARPVRRTARLRPDLRPDLASVPRARHAGEQSLGHWAARPRRLPVRAGVVGHRDPVLRAPTAVLHDHGRHLRTFPGPQVRDDGIGRGLGAGDDPSTRRPAHGDVDGAHR